MVSQKDLIKLSHPYEFVNVNEKFEVDPQGWFEASRENHKLMATRMAHEKRKVLSVNSHDHRAQLPALLSLSHARPSQRKANAWKVTPSWDVLCVTLHMLCEPLCSFDL